MAIPEMQKLKEKFPVYKEISDATLLKSVATKFPKQYGDIATREFGQIKEAPKGIIEGGMDATFEQFPGLKAGKVVLEQTFGRLMGGIKATASGGSFATGLQRPNEQPSFVESANKAVKTWRLPDPITEQLIGDTVGVALEVAIPFLLFGAANKTVGGVSKLYRGAQGKELAKFRSAVMSEFKEAGMSEVNAARETDILIARQWVANSPLKNMPTALKKSTEFLNANKGKVANLLKEQAKGAKASADAQGFTADVIRKAGKQPMLSASSKV